eukprot:jgi/Botrbrau1/11234/Bobra.0038s0006.1
MQLRKTVLAAVPSCMLGMCDDILVPALHQVAGHHGKGSHPKALSDSKGAFYKPLQDGMRGDTEAAFYQKVWASNHGAPPTNHSLFQAGALSSSPPTADADLGPQPAQLVQERGANGADVAIGADVANGADVAVLRSFIPKFYGVVERGGTRYLMMEEVTALYRKPCVMDVKIGYRTWHPGEAPAALLKARKRDADTCQSTLGFRICGMQVYRQGSETPWRADKEWCKQLSGGAVLDALRSFAGSRGSQSALADVYGPPTGVLPHLQTLWDWFQVQEQFAFVSASLLILYEGEPGRLLSPKVRFIDFAHTFCDQGQVDHNFASGLTAFIRTLSALLPPPRTHD